MHSQKEVLGFVAAVEKLRSSLTRAQIKQIGGNYDTARSKLELAREKATRLGNNLGEIRGILFDARALFKNKDIDAKIIRRAKSLLERAKSLRSELASQEMGKLGESRYQIASNKLERAATMVEQLDSKTNSHQILGLIEDSILLFRGAHQWRDKTFQDLQKEARQRRRLRRQNEDGDGMRFMDMDLDVDIDPEMDMNND